MSKCYDEHDCIIIIELHIRLLPGPGYLTVHDFAGNHICTVRYPGMRNQCSEVCEIFLNY